MGGTGVSKSEVSRLCAEIDDKVKAFLDHPLEGDGPRVQGPGADATYVKVRRRHRIVSVAVIIAVGVNAAGRREALGMDIGSSEAETFWTDLPHASSGDGGSAASSWSSPTPTRASRPPSPS